MNYLIIIIQYVSGEMEKDKYVIDLILMNNFQHDLYGVMRFYLFFFYKWSYLSLFLIKIQNANCSRIIVIYFINFIFKFNHFFVLKWRASKYFNALYFLNCKSAKQNVGLHLCEKLVQTENRFIFIAPFTSKTAK